MTDAPGQRPASWLDGVAGYVVALAGLAGTAGLIHIVVSIDHVDEDRLEGVFFVAVGALQLYAARRILRAPHEEVTLRALAIGSLAVALLWIVSRTVGLPFGLDDGEVSQVGVADAIATTAEIALAALVVAALRRSPRLAWFDSAVATRFMTAVLSAALMIAALGGHEH